MTESVMALPDGSPNPGVHSPPLLTRARAKASVTHGERRRPSPRPRVAPDEPVRARVGVRIVARAAAVPRRIVRVMYLDAADSWVVRDSTPSIRQVWAADYTANVPDHALLRFWCRSWRYPAVTAAAVLDSAKWMLIHPVRGPLFMLTTGGTVAGYTLI